MTNWHELICQAVSEFNKLPVEPKLTVSDRMSLTDFRKSDLRKKAGCYIIYRGNGLEPYVGQTEKGSFGRIQRHLSPETQASKYWKEAPPDNFIAVIEIGNVWHQLALEGYLTFRTKTWPRRDSGLAEIDEAQKPNS